jgi:hypothetical protein
MVNFCHKKGDPLWHNEEVKRLLKKKSKRSRQETLVAKRAYTIAKNPHTTKMLEQNRRDIRVGRITEEEAAKHFEPLKLGYRVTQEKISKLRAELIAALNSNDAAKMRKMRRQISQQGERLRQYTLTLFEDIAKIIYSTYGNPTHIHELELPKFEEAKDFPRLFAMALPMSKWDLVGLDVLDDNVIHAAKASLHPNKGTVVEIDEQSAVSTNFNATVKSMRNGSR